MYHKKARFIFRFVSILFILASLTFSSSPSSAQQVVGKPPLKIVQIGDSYSAGNGARSALGEINYKGPAGCYRSPTNWGSQFKESLNDTFAVNYINRACSGAVIDNILSPREMDTLTPKLDGSCPLDSIKFPNEEFVGVYKSHPCAHQLISQINAIDESVDLVVMTIGGNDLGFDKIVMQCFVVGARDPDGCEQVVNDATGNLSDLEENLIDLFARIKARLKPGAKIVYVAYPQLSLDEDYVLYEAEGRNPHAVIYHAAEEVRALGVAGEEAQKAAMAAANAAAVITRGAVKLAYRGQSEKWVEFGIKAKK